MITLRRFAVEDAPYLQERYSSLSCEQIEKMICEWNSGKFDGKYFEMLAIISGGCIVGTISLYEHSSKVVSIGPEVFEPYRKNGYGKEAMLKACRIAADRGYKIVSQQIRTDNAASIALHLSLGFETSGAVYTNAKGNQVAIYLKSLL
jgi:RimJ/RimL family protein N-acetyltransferase